MAMIKCPEPECTNIVSDQAPACPVCGHPVRRVEYRFVTVSHNYKHGDYGGKTEFEALLKDSWQVVEEQMEDVVDSGELYGYRVRYKL